MGDLSSSKSITLPTCWEDDVQMNFLFSPFRNKLVNPEGWEGKMRFWTDLIINVCFQTQTTIIDRDKLNSFFERNGRIPECLDDVIEYMKNNSCILPLSEFCKASPKGWLDWGFDVLLQRPVTWGYSAIQNILNWTKTDEKLVMLPNVKYFANAIANKHKELVYSNLTDHVLYIENLQIYCKDICQGETFKMALIQLQRDNILNIFEKDGKKIVKFKSPIDQNIASLSELDNTIISIQSALKTLSTEISKLEENIENYDKEVRQLMKEHNKAKALQTLKKKKRLEIILKKKEMALHNLESLFDKLQNLDSEKMILDAYKTGVQAMKKAMKGGLDPDNVDVTMAEVEETLDTTNEIQDMLSKSVTDDRLEDFEDELNELLSAEKPSALAKEKLQPLPQDVDDQLWKRLEALKSPINNKDISQVKKPLVN